MCERAHCNHLAIICPLQTSWTESHRRHGSCISRWRLVPSPSPSCSSSPMTAIGWVHTVCIPEPLMEELRTRVPINYSTAVVNLGLWEGWFWHCMRCGNFFELHNSLDFSIPYRDYKLCLYANQKKRFIIHCWSLVLFIEKPYMLRCVNFLAICNHKPTHDTNINLISIGKYM